MQNAPALSANLFGELFAQLLSVCFLARLFQKFGPGKRRAFKLRPHELIMGMVFHVLSGAGTLAEHVRQLTGIAISDRALAQRRGNLGWEIFEPILQVGLKPRAEISQHPHAF